MDIYRYMPQKMKRNLRPRIMILILVTFLPIALSLIALSITVLVRFAEQSGDRALHELALGMERVERDAVSVEHYADEFTRRYLTEINADAGIRDAMVPYDMIGDLGRWYSHLGLPGFVYLYDSTAGKSYIKYYGSTLDTAARERITAEVETFAAETGSLNFEMRGIGGRDYLCRTCRPPTARTSWAAMALWNPRTGTLSG